MARSRTWNRWTEEEVEILREWWPKAGERHVQDMLGTGKTIISVRNKAMRLGIKKGPNRWGYGSDRQTFEALRIELQAAKTINVLLKQKVIALEAQLRRAMMIGSAS